MTVRLAPRKTTMAYPKNNARARVGRCAAKGVGGAPPPPPPRRPPTAVPEYRYACPAFFASPRPDRVPMPSPRLLALASIKSVVPQKNTARIA